MVLVYWFPELVCLLPGPLLPLNTLHVLLQMYWNLCAYKAFVRDVSAGMVLKDMLVYVIRNSTSPIEEILMIRLEKGLERKKIVCILHLEVVGC